jgi:GT2 family glycosyltransferase
MTCNYAVVLLNYKNAQATLDCARSILAQSVAPRHLILCDNDSRNGSLESIMAWARQFDACVTSRSALEAGTFCDSERSSVIVIDNQANLGYAGGNNVGIRIALSLGCEHVWILNNDTIAQPEAARYLLEYMQGHPACGICGALTRYLHDPQIVQCHGGGMYNKWLGTVTLLGEGHRVPLEETRAPVNLRLDYVNGASVFVSRAFIEAVGLMDERYFLYCEELDWAYRARGLFSLGYEPQAVVLHMEGLSTGASKRRGLRRSLRSSLMLLKSKALLTAKFFPYALPSMVLSQFLIFAYRAARSLLRRLQ